MPVESRFERRNFAIYATEGALFSIALANPSALVALLLGALLVVMVSSGASQAVRATARC